MDDDNATKLAEAQAASAEAKAVVAELRAKALRLPPGSSAWRAAESHCADAQAKASRLSAAVTRLLTERQAGSTERRRVANAAHEARQAMFERHFFNIAKERLDSDIYREWVCEADRRTAEKRPATDATKLDLLDDYRRRLALVGKRSTELQEELDAARKTRDAARASADRAARDLRDAKERIAVLERELREARQAPERPVVLRAVPAVVAATEPTAAPDPEMPRRSRPPGACVVPGCFRGRLMKDGTCGRHGASEAV